MSDVVRVTHIFLSFVKPSKCYTHFIYLVPDLAGATRHKFHAKYSIESVAHILGKV